MSDASKPPRWYTRWARAMRPPEGADIAYTSSAGKLPMSVAMRYDDGPVFMREFADDYRVLSVAERDARPLVQPD